MDWTPKYIMVMVLGIVFLVASFLSFAVYSNYGAYYRAGYCVQGVVTVGKTSWTHYSKPPNCGITLEVPR